MKSAFAFICLVGLSQNLVAKAWKIDDVLLAEQADYTDLSRDGRLAVWVKTQMDPHKGEVVSNLYLTILAENLSIQLTRGSDVNLAAKFSPDGRRIAFLSSRSTDDPARSEADGAQIWLIETRGGEPWRVTTFQKGVETFAWLDDTTLLAAAAEDASLYEQQVKARKDTSVVVEDEEHASPVRLFRIDINDGSVRRLTNNSDRIESLAVSADGAYAVTVHDRSLRYKYDSKIKPVTFLHELKTSKSRQLFGSDTLVPSHIVWALDDRGFYFSAPHGSDPVYLEETTQRLYYCERDSGQVTEVDLNWEAGLAGGRSFAPSRTSTEFVALLANGVKPRAARYVRTAGGWTRNWIENPGASNMFGLQLAADGKTIVYRHSTASAPEQWAVATLEQNRLRGVRPLAELNAGLKQMTIARTEIAHWKGARDEDVEGIVYFPHDYVPGRKYPLVAVIHGGPDSVDRDEFTLRQGGFDNLLAGRNAFVLRLNYHGSTEYGLKWAESIGNGNYNELEWIDVEKGVDALIARGLVDPDRLGLAGGSNGAIITIELTTRTTRYKAAIAVAGDVNWITDWSNCKYGHSFGHYYLGKVPFDDPQYFIQKSPFFRMDKVRTPTLIMFGTEDKDVPTEEGWQHYRALQYFGNTNTRFVLFPGEGHSLSKLEHQRRSLEEQLAWLDKYLFRTPADQPELFRPGLFRPGSLLDAALKKKNSALAPELARRDGIGVGRFEVTRDQYALFDSSHRFPAGTGQYPVSGISLAEAAGYCAWLSGKTGQRYRLPTEQEMDRWTTGVSGENTLDYWAGDRLNPDDALRLALPVETLGPDELLRPVGSFAAIGDDPIFDLGGNVAEWAVAKDGTGKPLGYSADRPADPKSVTPPRPNFIGFRVVLEQ